MSRCSPSPRACRTCVVRACRPGRGAIFMSEGVSTLSALELIYLEPNDSEPAWTRCGPVPRHRRYLFSLASVPWPCATLPVFGSSDCRLSLHVMLCGCFVRDGAFFLRIVMSCSL